MTTKVYGNFEDRWQKGGAVYAADGGSSDTYAVTYDPPIKAYTTGMVIQFYANTANTGTATLNVNGLGAKTIRKMNDATLETGDIEAGQLVTVIYDGTYFQMQSQTAQVSATVITGTVGVTNGGTGRATSTTAYGLLAAGTTATGAHQTLATAGAATEILVGGGAAALPAWGTNIPTAVTIGSKYIYRADGTDVPIADGGTGASTASAAFTALKQDATASATGVVLLEPKQNLLTNSGFKVWSNGTLENVGDQISVSDITAGVCTTADTEGLAIGKLVKFGAGGSTAGLVYEVTAVTANTNFTINDTTITDATAVTCYEVTPGTVAADEKGPDGWAKEGAIAGQMWRQHNDSTYTKAGSFYALKATGGVALSQMVWPTVAAGQTAAHIKRFGGRTVTMGCWVWADAANKARIGLYNTTYSAYHTGGSTWEWLEVTATPSAAASSIFFSLGPGISNTAYFSQPMLVFGSKIGEGNYAEPPGEIVNVEANIALTDYTADAVTADATINLEAQSNGKIPKGAKAVYGWIEGQNSAADKYLDILSASGGIKGTRMYCQVNGKDVSATFRQVCDANGDMYVDVEDGNWTNVTIQVNAAQVN